MASFLRSTLSVLAGCSIARHGWRGPMMPDIKRPDGSKPSRPRPRPVLSTSPAMCAPSSRTTALPVMVPTTRRRKAGLRLDTKEGVMAKLKSGGAAVVPGKPDESDLIFRLETDDPEAKMPPKKFGKQLTAQQIADPPPLGRAGGDLDHALGIRAAAQGRPACRQEHRLAAQSDRPVHPGPARG